MIVRIYNGPDGKSCFEDLEEPPHLGVDVQSAGARFTLRQAGTATDWHNPAVPTYVITLTGKSEVEAEDGTKRVLGPGDILLAEDFTGKGHVSRNIGSEDRLFVSISIPG